jgi:integrase
MLQEGVHPKIVSERLGHSSIQITLNTYSSVLPDLQSEAAQKLDKALFGKSDDTDEVKENRAIYSTRVAN